MASEYDLKLVVDADTSAAEQKLDGLGGSVHAATPEAREAAERVRAARSGGTNNAAQNGGAKDFGRQAGEVAGRTIGAAVAGYLSHQVADVVFSRMKTPGADNRTVNKAESSFKGAAGGAAMGFAAAGPLGAVIGGLAGAVTGLAAEQTRQRNVRQERDLGIRMSDYSRGRDGAVQASDKAFADALQMSGSRRRRVEMLQDRRREIAAGDGRWAIPALEKMLKTLDPESARGKIVAGNLEMQRARVAALDQQIIQDGLPWRSGRIDAAAVTDSYGKRGLEIGSQVNVAAVNDKIMTDVQAIRGLLEQIAAMGTDEVHSLESITKAVYR